MNSSEVLDLAPTPNPVSLVQDSNQIDYFSQLPNEMLMEVFQYLHHPKDLQRCSRVCCRFEYILEPQFIYASFPEVLPLLSTYLRMKERLTLRGVCKGWTLVVAEFLDDEDSFRRNNRCVEGRMIKFFKFGNETQKFLRELEDVPPSYNPFPTRGMSFDREWADDLTLALPFLRTFGEYIWKTRINLFFRNEEQDVEVQTLFECLSLMPNLKEVTLVGPDGYIDTSRYEVAGLQQILNNLQYPALTNLMNLKLIDLPTALTHVIFNECSMCRNLESLECGPHVTSLAGMKFPKLRELDMFGDSLHEIDPHLTQLSVPALTTLVLAFDIQDIDVPHLINILTSSVGSLQDFKFQLETNHNKRALKLDGLNVLEMSKLQKFEISGFAVESYDFLPGFAPCLQHFAIDVDPSQWTDKTYITKIDSMGISGFGRECICDSNIWTILPELKTVSIKKWGKQIEKCSRSNNGH